MTVFDVNKLFSGISCPDCNQKVSIEFNSENLFTPFPGFKNDRKICCSKFHEQLNHYILLHEEGKISEADLAAKLNRYKQSVTVQKAGTLAPGQHR